MQFSTLSCQHISCVYLGCIYLQPGQSIGDFKKELTLLTFSVKNEGRASITMPTVFSATFPAKQITQSPDFNGHTISKNANKKYSKPSQVISNSLQPAAIASRRAILTTCRVLPPAAVTDRESFMQVQYSAPFNHWNAARDSDVLSTLLSSNFRLHIKIAPNHCNIGQRLFFRGTHKVGDDLQLSHFVG